MNPFNSQHNVRFWNNAALGDNKDFKQPVVFDDPINIEELSKYINKKANILDFGCGYGRITDALYQSGFSNVCGVDIADKMLERGKKTYPHLRNKFYLYDGETLPFDSESFDTITAFTVLNAIPEDKALNNIFKEFKRTLKRPGIIYIFEFMLTPFQRDISRYDSFQEGSPNAPYGTFKHSSGSIMRHFSKDTIENTLLSDFELLWHDSFEFKSMNGNPCIDDQWIARFSQRHIVTEM